MSQINPRNPNKAPFNKEGKSLNKGVSCNINKNRIEQPEIPAQGPT
jgi:hypothetical protein